MYSVAIHGSDAGISGALRASSLISPVTCRLLSPSRNPDLSICVSQLRSTELGQAQGVPPTGFEPVFPP